VAGARSREASAWPSRAAAQRMDSLSPPWHCTASLALSAAHRSYSRAPGAHSALPPPDVSPGGRLGPQGLARVPPSAGPTRTPSPQARLRHGAGPGGALKSRARRPGAGGHGGAACDAGDDGPPRRSQTPRAALVDSSPSQQRPETGDASTDRAAPPEVPKRPT
jgi:hypothetical protein